MLSLTLFALLAASAAAYAASSRTSADSCQTKIDQAVAVLKLTTTGYAGHTVAWYANTGTNWYKGLKLLAQARAGCIAAPAPPPPPVPSGESMPIGDLPGWHQVFADDFPISIPPGGFPGSTEAPPWTAYPAGWPDTSGHGTRYPPAISVHDGLLDQPTGWDGAHFVDNAVLPVLPRMLYGRFAVRFKADPIAGFKTAWLLWPDSEVWPRDGEIDFPEGDLTGSVCAFMHRQNATTGSDQDAYCSNVAEAGAWHTAIIEWLPSRVTFLLDGQVVGQSTNRIPDTPMHWVIQTETQFGALPPLTAYGHIYIDWVVAYQPASAPLPTPSPTGWPGNPYPLGSIWNPGHVIPATVAVDPNSAAIMQWFTSHLSTARTLNTDSYAVAVAVDRGGEPTYNGPWNCEYSSCDLTRFGPIPIPLGTKPDPGGDGHLAVLDIAHGKEWDFWKASFDGTTWHAGCGNSIYLSERAAAVGVCGANDANLPAAAGIIQPEEIAAGVIKHPLVFAVPARGTGPPRCPSTFEAHVDPASPVVNGMWFQLDPSLDVASLSLPAWQKTVARAMQQYGMFVRDGSPGIDVYGENPLNRAPSAWANLGLAGDPSFASGFPWNRMRVLAAPC